MTDSNEPVPVTDVEEGVAEPATEKEKEKKSVTHQLVFWSMNILGFAPIVVWFVIADKRIAVTVSTALTVLNFFLSLVYYKIGGTKCWPKVIDVSLVTTFGILLILIWALPEEGAYVKSDVIAYFDAWIFGGFAADITSAWVCFKVPFAKQLYMDEVSEEELTHPGTKYLIKETTLAFICGFGMAGVFAIVRGSLMVTGKNTNTLDIVMQVLMWCSVAYGINMAAWVLPKYSTTDKFNNMIAEKYGEEVEAWNAKHPDHEWAKEWAKAIEAETE